MSFFGFGKRMVSAPAPLPDPRIARRVEIGTVLLKRAYDVAANEPEIRGTPHFRNHVIALGHAVTTAVANIGFTPLQYGSDPPFYSDIWTRNIDCFHDLASLLSYWFTGHAILPGEPKRDTRTNELMGVAALVYEASKRAHRLIERYAILMNDPSEMRDRRILGVFAGSEDTEARGVVLAFVINEALGGPRLELDVSDETSKGVAIDPAYALWFRAWMTELQLALIVPFREASQGRRDVPLDEYAVAATAAFDKATGIVGSVYG